jgi:hypothetical protein
MSRFLLVDDCRGLSARGGAGLSPTQWFFTRNRPSPQSSRGILKRCWKKIVTGSNPARSRIKILSISNQSSKSHHISRLIWTLAFVHPHPWAPSHGLSSVITIHNGNPQVTEVIGWMGHGFLLTWLSGTIHSSRIVWPRTPTSQNGARPATGLLGGSHSFNMFQQELWIVFILWFLCGYGSIPINTIFRGMNIHLPAILMFTRGTRFWHTAMWK